MSLRRNHLILMSLLLLLGGCQTTGSNNWVPAGNQTSVDANNVAANGVSSSIVGAESVDFELGGNPYAYDDIPPNTRPSQGTPEAGLWYIFDKHEQEIRTAGNNIADAELRKYIAQVICDLAGPYCSDMRVYVQNIPMFNATMAANGMMNVYSGFLLRMQNEAQMAAVLGHEIGHYIRRHSIQGMADRHAKQDFMMGFRMVMLAAGMPAISDIADLMATGAIFSYGRDNEREADLIGINLLAKNGYDAREAAKIWRQLILEQDADADFDDLSTSAAFSSSHPAQAERMITLDALAQELQGPGKWGKTHKSRFDRYVGPWKFRFLEDEVRLRQWKSSLNLLNIIKDNGHDLAEVYFFRGEIFRGRGRKADDDREKPEERPSDQDRAIEAYQASIKTGSPPPQAYRALGEIFHRLGKHDDARDNLTKYIMLAPRATDVNMIKFVLGTLTGS